MTDKRYKLGLKLWSINTDYYYDEAIRLYNDGVYDYIELYVVPNSIKTLPQWVELEIPFIIHAPHFMHGFNLAKKECEAGNIKKYNEVKEFADALIVDHIILHGGIDGHIDETARQLSALDEPRALIENKPFRAIPNNMGGEFCRGATIDELQTVIETAKCGFCFDIGHAICSAVSQGIESYDYLAEFTKLNPAMYHLTDIESLDDEYDKHLHIGTGALDVKKILSVMPKNATITLETNKDSKVNLNDFINDTEYVRK